MSTSYDSSPTLWFSSASRGGTFNPINEVIDVLMIDVLMNASTSSSIVRCSLSWLLGCSLVSHMGRISISVFFGLYL